MSPIFFWTSLPKKFQPTCTCHKDLLRLVPAPPPDMVSHCLHMYLLHRHSGPRHRGQQLLWSTSKRVVAKSVFLSRQSFVVFLCFTIVVSHSSGMIENPSNVMVFPTYNLTVFVNVSQPQRLHIHSTGNCGVTKPRPWCWHCYFSVHETPKEGTTSKVNSFEVDHYYI